MNVRVMRMLGLSVYCWHATGGWWQVSSVVVRLPKMYKREWMLEDCILDDLALCQTFINKRDN